jgi:hypothetical protein
MARSKMYTPITDKDEHDTSSSASTTNDDIEGLLSATPQARFLPAKSPTKLLAILLPITSILSIILGILLNQIFFPVTPLNLDKACSSHFQQYSPVLAEVDTSVHLVHFNGSLMKANAFRGPAGPETDAAWDSIGVNCELFSYPLVLQYNC